MKRFIVVLCVVGLLAVLMFSHEAFAKKKAKKSPVKVDICHATASTPLESGGTLIIGHVITVSENAVPAHLAHGDSTDFGGLDDEGAWAGHTWGELAEWYGLDLTDTNCAARLP